MDSGSRTHDLLHLEMMAAHLRLILSVPTGDEEHDQRGQDLLEAVEGTLALYEKNPGELATWPLAERIRMIAMTHTEGPESDWVKDLIAAAEIITDYELMCAATGHVHDDRLYGRPA